MNRPLRIVSYLAPSLPHALFDCLAQGLEKHGPLPVELVFDDSVSGPRPGSDPFTAGQYDGAFLCAPSVRWLLDSGDDPIRLVPAAPVFDDARLRGQPHYYSDVVVREDHPATEFNDLEGCRWGYNDPCSLSGYFSGVQLAEQSGHPDSFFGETRQLGSHLECLEALLRGELDAAAIDSNALLWRRQCDPRLQGLRVLVSAGPYPVQPLVVATRHASRTSELANALTETLADDQLGPQLESFGVTNFAPVRFEDYTHLPPVCDQRGLL